MSIKWEKHRETVGRWSYRVGREHGGGWGVEVYESKKPGEVKWRSLGLKNRSTAKARGCFMVHQYHSKDKNRGAA